MSPGVWRGVSILYVDCCMFTTPCEGTHFQRVIPDNVPGDNVDRVVFCTGKLYYELVKERESQRREGAVAICRIEQVGLG